MLMNSYRIVLINTMPMYYAYGYMLMDTYEYEWLACDQHEYECMRIDVSLWAPIRTHSMFVVLDPRLQIVLLQMHGSMLKAANEYMVRCLYLRMPMLMNVITYEHECLCLLDGWMVLNNYGHALNYAILL